MNNPVPGESVYVRAAVPVLRTHARDRRGLVIAVLNKTEPTPFSFLILRYFNLVTANRLFFSFVSLDHLGSGVAQALCARACVVVRGRLHHAMFDGDEASPSRVIRVILVVPLQAQQLRYPLGSADHCCGYKEERKKVVRCWWWVS